MSIISKLLRDYSQIRVSYELVGKDSSKEITKILNQLAAELAKKEWRCSPSEISNPVIAISAFFEMFALKIGGDAPIMQCYYYSTLVANDNSLPTNVRTIGNKFRAFIVFKAMNKLNMTFNLACNAPFAGYRGCLNSQQFFDFALLSDVYKAWDSDNNSVLLQNLKKQAPMVAAHHPDFSKQQIITEGELAHKAVFEVVETMI